MREGKFENFDMPDEVLEKNKSMEVSKIESENVFNQFEEKIVLTKEEIRDKLIQQLRKNKENTFIDEDLDFQAKKQELAGKLIIDSTVFKDVVVNLEKQSKFLWIETNKIIGRPYGNQSKGGWSFEYDNRKGRINDIAKELINIEKNPENIEEVFHYDKPNERIKLIAIEGPVGPLYIAEDGTHRVAGAMEAELQEIPCDVNKIQYPLEYKTTNKENIWDWENKIKLGLIQGEIKKQENNDGQIIYKLTVQREVLPWIRASQSDLIRISKAYEKLYPGSLENLNIPRDALVDPIANNFFMSGRWNEWTEKFSEKPRDQDGIVIY